MGHDIHFLERLERYSPSHTELAMSLYRDPELIKAVLNDRRVPDRAERVAIAITNEPSGPHIVVQRNGRFVTALGEGMTTGDLPIISRAALDSAGARVTRLRSLMEKAKDVAGPTGLSATILGRLTDAGPWLSREEAAAVAVWVRLGGGWLRAFRSVARSHDEIRYHFLRNPKSRSGDRGRRLKLKRMYWNASWAQAHLLSCVIDGHQDFLNGVDHETQLEFFDVINIDRLLGSGMRTSWMAGRLGKILLPALKQRWLTSDYGLEGVRFGADLLGAIGLARTKLRAEAEKILRRPPGHWQNFEGEELDGWKRHAKDTVALSLSTLEKPEEALREYEELSRRQAVERGRHLTTGNPFRFEKPEDVPMEIALATPLISTDEVFVIQPETWRLSTIGIPWLARASLEETYLPGDCIRAWEVPFREEDVDRIVGNIYDGVKPTPIVHDFPRIGRNDPCTCGSGKKYKKCCAS